MMVVNKRWEWWAHDESEKLGLFLHVRYGPSAYFIPDGYLCDPAGMIDVCTDGSMSSFDKFGETGPLCRIVADR